MPDLSKLSLDELIQMRAMIMTLCEAGKTLALEGDGVVFDLTPGRAARIVTPFQVPEFGAQQTQLEAMTAPTPEEVDVQAIVNAVFADMDRAAQLKLNSPPAVPGADGAAIEPAPAVVTATAGADAALYDGLDFPDAGGPVAAIPDLDPVAPPPAAVVEPSPAARATVAGDVACDASDDGGGDPVLVEVKAKHAPGPRWTEEEDARLVAVVAARLQKGVKMTVAAAYAAEIIGRPQPATAYRCKAVLHARIYDKLASLKALDVKAKPAPEQTVCDDAAGGQASAGAGVAAPAPAAPKPEPKPAPAPKPPANLPSELASAAAHLRSVTPFGKWTPALDRDLLRQLEDLRWPLHEVCLDLGVTTVQAQQRLHMLTKGKALKNAEIWAAMQAVGYGLSDELA